MDGKLVCRPLGRGRIVVPAGHELRVHPHIVEDSEGYQVVRSFYGAVCGADPIVQARGAMVALRGPRGKRIG